MSVSDSMRPDGSPSQAPQAIDLAVLDGLAADIGDREFVVETVRVYLAELPGRIEAIVVGAERGDAAAVRAAAHALKSSSGMLGALGLANICRELELISDPLDHDDAGYGTLLGVLAAESVAVTAGLTRYVDGEGGSS
jgi:HPt (histidine-containing phosphotransfer) domain-containing protein